MISCPKRRTIKDLYHVHINEIKLLFLHKNFHQNVIFCVCYADAIKVNHLSEANTEKLVRQWLKTAFDRDGGSKKRADREKSNHIFPLCNLHKIYQCNFRNH